jgi:anti-sigma factor (TIGR02949 family)
VSCDELLRRLTEFSDGVLPEPLCDEVRRHLAECDLCSELRADLVSLSRLCRECPPPRMPEDLRRRLADRLGREDGEG